MSSLDFQYQTQVSNSIYNTLGGRGMSQNYGNSRQGQMSSFQPDAEVDKLNDQIDEIEEKIANLKSEMKKKSSQYQAQIENLQNEVQKKKIDFETAISALRQQNTNELAELSAEQQEELSQQKATFEATNSRQNDFSLRRNEALRLRKVAEITDLTNELESKKIKYNQQNFDATTTTQQGKIEAQQREAELRAQIEILNDEIDQLASARSEDLQRTRVKIDEISSAFDTRIREQKDKIERYNQEIEKRTVQFADQLRALEAQKQMEKEQLDNEIKSTNERLQSLQQLYSKIEKRNATELNLTQQDIEKLSEAIQRAKEREAEQLEEAKEQIAKMQEAQNDNLAIEEEIESIKQEIAQIKKDNADMRKEKQRLDNMLYNARLSKHRSTLK